MLEHAANPFLYFFYMFLTSIGNAAGFVFFVHQYLKPRFHWVVSLLLFTLNIFVLTLFRDSMPPQLRAALISPLLFILYTSLVFHGTLKRKLVITGACYLCALMVESITAVILLIMHIDYKGFINSSFFDILYSDIIMTAFLMLFAIMLQPVLKSNNKFGQKGDGATSLMVFVAIVAIALLICFAIVLPQNNITTLIVTSLCVCLTTGSLLLIFHLLVQMRMVMENEKEQELLQQSYELSLARTKQALSYRSEIDALQGNMNLILDNIGNHLKNSDVLSALAMAGKNISVIEDIKRTKRYHNSVADYLILKAEKQCAEQQTPFAVDYSFPKDIGIDEMDFCVVLSNILDNAVNACKKIHGEQFIKLSLHKNNHILFIGCKNSRPVEGNTEKPNRRMGSFGLRNIKEAAEKYHGDVQISQDHDTFSIEVLLYCEE